MTINYAEAVTTLLQGKFNKDKISEFMQEHAIKPRIVSANADHIAIVKNNYGYQLQKKIIDGDITYPEAVEACQSIIQTECTAHNAVMFMTYEMAAARSKMMQKEYEEGDILVRRPLFGYIFCLKDVFAMKGTPSTCGLYCNLDRVPKRNSPLVEQLLGAGAVIICKGTVPQLLFSMETANNITGRCSAPNSDFQRSSGGSSGGDACIVALGGAAASISSDIAGSLRIPALSCGIVAFKPTVNRISIKSHMDAFTRNYGSGPGVINVKLGAHDKQNVISAVAGPMARCVLDLKNIMKVICTEQNYDQWVPPLGWSLNPKPLKRIGYFLSMPIFPSTLPAQRAVQETVRKLKNIGYEVIEMPKIFIDLLEEVARYAILAFNKNKELEYVLRNSSSYWTAGMIGEPLDAILHPMHQICSANKLLLKMVLYKESNTRRRLLIEKKLEADATRESAISSKFHDVYQTIRTHFEDMNIDAVIHPGLPLPPVEHGQGGELMLCAAYCFVWNALNFCGGVIPTTQVRSDENYYSEHVWKDAPSDMLSKSMDKAVGLPVGIGIYGLPYSDELIIDIMLDIEKVISKANQDTIDHDNEMKNIIKQETVEITEDK